MSATHLEPDRFRVAASAVIHPDVSLGEGVSVWDLSQIREGVRIGADTVIGRNVYVDHDVRIGSGCKIQNNVLIYSPALIGNGVFLGPGAILTNDTHPRSVNPDGTSKGAAQWTPVGVTVENGAAIGAGAVILGGVRVGSWGLVGVGAVVTRDVAAHALVLGNPARQVGWVGKTGRRLVPERDSLVDPVDGTRFRLIEGNLEESV